MAETWVTVPLDQIIRHEGHPDGIRAAKRCTLCNTQTVPGGEAMIEEQIRIHLQRRHLTVLETSTGRLPNRTRAKLIAQGWTPPVIERLEDEGRASPDQPPNARPTETSQPTT